MNVFFYLVAVLWVGCVAHMAMLCCFVQVRLYACQAVWCYCHAVWLCSSACLCVFMHVLACLFVCLFVYMNYACVYACVYAYVHVCVCLCVYERACTCVYKCTFGYDAWCTNEHVSIFFAEL